MINFVLNFIHICVLTFFLLFSTITCATVNAEEICDSTCAQEAKSYAALAEAVYSGPGMPSNLSHYGWSVHRHNGKLVEEEWFQDAELNFFSPTSWIKWGISSFYAALYHNEFTDEYAISYRGTHLDDWGDWLINFYQFFGLMKYIDITNQYDVAVSFANRVKTIVPDGTEFVVVGDSLGGGLATWATLKESSGPKDNTAYFNKAYVFNPARINKMSQESIYSYWAEIKSYVAVDVSKGNKDIVSSLGTPSNNTTDYLIRIPDAWGDYSPLDLHDIWHVLRPAIVYIAGDFGVAHQTSHSNPQGEQIGRYSSPGGIPITQRAWNLTPNADATLFVEYLELESIEEISIIADANGKWSVDYLPSAVKPVGTYEWWVTDDTSNKSTDKFTYNISPSNAETPWYGYEGSEIVDNSPADCLPDFVAKRAWITTSEHGNDKYIFTPWDDAWINVKVANEGCEDSPQDIAVWYFLSNGEKEDGHHDWEKIGDDTIRQAELLIGLDKWEKEEFTLPNEPGTYNIVACADRIAQYDNGDGDVIEEHKSNDCSTEAVFTVLPSIPAEEHQALVSLYDSTNGTGWSNNDGWKTDSDPCSWYGVTCSDRHVSSLSLGGNQLNGPIPSEIGDLTNLAILRLGSNQLSGSVPPEIGNLTRLTYLTLSTNQLTGSVPTEIGNLYNLKSLALTDNQLSGSLPTEVGYLTNLTQLFLDSNQFSGSIPSEIGNLLNLRHLLIDRNQLSGSVPPEIGNLTELIWLSLEFNQLDGVIPSEIGNLIKLSILSLQYNQLSGSIPLAIGNLINLTKLDLGFNQLSGFVPSEIGNLNKLSWLFLRYNQLSGVIPTEIGNLSKVDNLDLRNNQFNGLIPSEIGNLAVLSTLNLSNNQLTGSIPSTISNLSNLTRLYLYDNKLDGAVPSEIGNLTQLNSLALNSNQLSGSIPIELGNLINLTYLNLSDNMLNGSIPRELGNLTNLTLLWLDWNQLTGFIPLEIANLNVLEYLSLSNNLLRGIVPLEVAQSAPNEDGACDFSNNTSSLCIPNTSDYRAIGVDPICYLSLSNSCKPGDINQDHTVNLVDIILGLQILTGQAPSQPVVVDYTLNGNGKIGMPEVIYTLRAYADLP